MPNSQTQGTSSAVIPPSPPLIDILTYLKAGQRAFFDDPDSQAEEVAVFIITAAAKDAFKKKKPFTKDCATEYVERMGLRQEIRDCVDALIHEVEVEAFGDLVGMAEWACQRIVELTGLSIYEIGQTIERCVDDKPLDAVYGETDTSLNHVAKKLRELDRDGLTKTIWRKVWEGSSVIRNALEMLRSSQVTSVGAIGGGKGLDSSPEKSRGQRNGKRGRPSDSKPEDDKRLFDGWHTGQYQNLAELAREFDQTLEQVKHAVDRHRKRLERGTAPQ